MNTTEPAKPAEPAEPAEPLTAAQTTPTSYSKEAATVKKIYTSLVKGNATDSESDNPGDCFITPFGALTGEETAPTKTDLFSSTIATTDSCYASRYVSEAFMGIMIDTSASTKSTAGYGQFQALHSPVATHQYESNQPLTGEMGRTYACADRYSHREVKGHMIRKLAYVWKTPRLWTIQIWNWHPAII
jgi:hypothetical protein